MLPTRNLSLTPLLTFSTLTFAAAINPPPNNILTTPNLPNTLTNQTIPPPSLNTLPPSPYTYPVPNAPTTSITFSTYTNPISELSALECILSATEDVAIALEAAMRARDPDSAVRQRYIRIDAEHASLVMTPVDGRLRWITWAQTLQALRRFLHRWEVVGLRFVVVEAGVRVAVGGLAGR